VETEFHLTSVGENSIVDERLLGGEEVPVDSGACHVSYLAFSVDLDCTHLQGIDYLQQANTLRRHQEEDRIRVRGRVGLQTQSID
jgi:hypothetical protein